MKMYDEYTHYLSEVFLMSGVKYFVSSLCGIESDSDDEVTYNFYVDFPYRTKEFIKRNPGIEKQTVCGTCALLALDEKPITYNEYYKIMKELL